MTQISSNDPDVGSTPNTVEVSTEWERVIVPTRASRFKFPKNKNVITILLIGETGSGKTSFMSLLLNLFEGKGLLELKDKHFVDAESGLDPSKSQTTEARLYSFITTDGIKVEILDTPGLADTRGIDEDKRHKERIYNAIQELVEEIDAIMIIANGTVERLTLATEYTLNILTTLFPRSILENIGVMFTNTVAGGGLNFKMRSLPPELQKAKYYCIDNPLSLYKNYMAQKASGTLSEAKQSRQMRHLEDCYEDAVETLDQWLAWLDERKPIPTKAIIELYQKSSYIESRLFAAITSIDNLSRLESQLLSVSLNLQTTAQQKDTLANLKKRLPPKVWVLEETTTHNTVCTVPDCHSNCHEGCSLELGDPATIGAWCKAFKTIKIANQCLPFWGNLDVRCGRIKCGHEARGHRSYQKVHKQIDSEYYRRIVRNLEEATTEEGRLNRAKAQIGQEIKGVKQEIEASKREIPKLVDELNNLSLSPNYAGYIWSAIEVLKMRKEQLMSRHDSGSELAAIEEGIKAFDAQLKLLKANEAGRVVDASANNVE